MAGNCDNALLICQLYLAAWINAWYTFRLVVFKICPGIMIN